jgi:hypothetical protein
MNRLNVARVADTLTSRLKSTVAASIVDYKLVTPSLARVVATFNTVEATREALCASVGAAFGNNASPIEASWRKLDTYGNPAMVGFVSLNREVKAYTDEAAKGMKIMASNMLMDAADDSLWDVREDGAGGKLLCRQNDNGLKALMETARVRQLRAPRLESVMSAADVGNFVAYVDPKSESVRYGYVLATGLEIAPQPVGGIDLDPEDRLNAVEILPLDQGQMPDNSSDETRGEGNRIAQRMNEENFPVTVPCSVIVEAAVLSGNDRVAEVAAPSNGLNKQSLLDYYGKLFAHRPDYYAELRDIINNHAGF